MKGCGKTIGSLGALVLAGVIALSSAALAQGRHALVIGNSSYRPGYELRNPIADARAIARQFSGLGFDVTIVEDSDLATVQRALDDFVPKAIASDAAAIYYAGHGAMVDGRSFMLPVDFSMSSFDQLDKEALDTDRLKQALSSTHADLKLLLFDACRNNPLESRGAKPLEQAGAQAQPTLENMFVAFSTTQGAVALDGQGDHSPFAEGLMANIRRADTRLEDVMYEVRKHVRDKTGGRQTVWIEQSLNKPFYLAASAPVSGRVTSLSVPEPDAGQGLVFPDSDRRRLTPDRFAGLDPARLRLARNEIFARHGMIFQDKSLAAHFGKFAWYRPRAAEVTLTALEQDNVQLIRRFEMIDSAPSAGFVFADSDRRLLEAGEVRGLPRQQLRWARNEIYARRGRKFVVREVREYFQQFDWYRPQFGEVELTYIEQKNVDLIRRFEN